MFNMEMVWIQDFPNGGMEAATCTAGWLHPLLPASAPTRAGRPCHGSPRDFEQEREGSGYFYLIWGLYRGIHLSLACAPATPLPATAAFLTVQRLGPAGEGSQATVWWESCSPHPA